MFVLNFLILISSALLSLSNQVACFHTCDISVHIVVSDGLLHILSVFIQERAFGELEKNSDKQLSSDSQGQTDPPSHFHQLLSGLHKHLLAHCYIHSGPEVHCSISYT